MVDFGLALSNQSKTLWDELFESNFPPRAKSWTEAHEQLAQFAACDVSEYEDHYLLAFDVPGIKREDLNIELTGRHLTVGGERKLEEDVEKGMRRQSQRAFGKFKRSFVLPEGIDPKEVEASYENGVLKIVIPKGEAAKTRKVEIGDKSFFKRLTTKSES